MLRVTSMLKQQALSALLYPLKDKNYHSKITRKHAKKNFFAFPVVSLCWPRTVRPVLGICYGFNFNHLFEDEIRAKFYFL